MDVKKTNKTYKETQFRKLIRELTYKGFLLVEKFIHQSSSVVEPNNLHNQ